MPRNGKRNSHDLFEERIRKSLRVDARFSVLEFKSERDYLYIFADSLASVMHLSQLYQKTSPRFRIKVVLLPDKSVGSLTKGVCHVGVAPLRKSPASSSEQMTQLLYGETFETLQTTKGWVRIRLHSDGYVGWISSDQVTLMGDEAFYDYQFLPKVCVGERTLDLLGRPSSGSGVVRECVLGSALRVIGKRGGFLNIRLPDGTVGWARKSGTMDPSARDPFSTRRLLETARSFLGISYVWGGRSAKGFDCSGFVQTVYRLNGVSLPRDADLQFLAGNRISGGIGRLRAGDLLFFSSDGHKISHVAIYMGRNKEFIHSSGFVRINSFDRKRKNFSSRLSSTFVSACRVI